MTQKEIVDIFKRFLIVFVCFIPLIVVLSICTTLSSAVVIIITVVVVGGVFALEEYLRAKKIKKRIERRKQKKD